MDKEIWKDIPQFEGIYQVSNFGSVRSFKYKDIYILKQSLNRNGYLSVSLISNTKRKTAYVHSLVAICFLNHTPNKHKIVINHKNFIKTDNNLYNLELVTNRENCNQKHLRSTSEYVGVCWHIRNKKWISHIKYKGKKVHLGYYFCEKEASDAYQEALNKINNNLHPKE